MAANLKSQFTFAFNMKTKKGRSKHSDKKSKNSNKHDIFYTSIDRKNHLKVAHRFADWMRENYPDVKQIVDVEAEHWQEFEKTLIAPNVNQNTLNNHSTLIGKIGRVCESVFKADLDWDFPTPEAGRGDEDLRCLKMSTQLWKEVMEQAYSNTRNGMGASDSTKGLDLCARYALRVNTPSKLKAEHIDLVNMILHVPNDKGGRDRDLPIDPADKTWFQMMLFGKKNDEYIFNVKPKALNMQLGRLLKAYDKKYGTNWAKIAAEHKTSVHMLRKMRATELYVNLCDERGLTCAGYHPEVWDIVDRFLGHNENRKNLFETYIVLDSSRILGDLY